ncbi:hypothetical protein SB11R_18680 [Pseudomonas oryzihabitans]|nr:hypothetical protein SB11R_18680 [Pseudomonas psychrotolerans]
MEPITSTATLTPTTQRQGVKVQTRPFKITDIPDAMDKMNWPVAAALMRHWFNGKPWPDTVDGGMSAEVKQHKTWPPNAYIEESIVKMDWLLRFEIVRKAMRELRSRWRSDKALAFVAENLRKNFSGVPVGEHSVGFEGKASAAERFGRFNTKEVVFSTFDTGSLDDLRAALANFNLRVAAEGNISIRPQGFLFRVERLVFYAEDSYDFRDPCMWYTQPLGFWNSNGMAKSLYEATLVNIGVAGTLQSNAGIFNVLHDSQEYADILSQRFFLVTNSMFSSYRKAYGKGGDFRVFSDVHYESLPRPEIIEFSR